VISSAQHHDRDCRQARVRLLHSPEGVTVHLGHVEVEYDEMNARRHLQLCEGVRPIARPAHLITLVFEDIDQDLAQVEIVVDNQESRPVDRAGTSHAGLSAPQVSIIGNLKSISAPVKSRCTPHGCRL
jgi:hypothetical protein